MPKFKVTHEDVEVLKITVLEGRGISVGWSDVFDTPDPYVKLKVSNSPNGKQRTQAIANNKNPKWNKELCFYLDPDKDRILSIKVMDEDFGFDDIVGDGEHTYDLKQLKVGEVCDHTFHFGGKTYVDVRMVIEINKTHQLRYGHDLCVEEEQFREARQQEVFEALKKLLPEDKMPENKDKVPVIAVMGSGGGFRAMTGLSGVFTALETSGILACTTYMAGLSGSSWYISTLIANASWPESSCEEVAREIEDRIDENFTRFLTPLHLVKYIKYINKKKCLGYPVSFTDFFGCLVGDTLLKDTTFRLSYAREHLNGGKAPLPLCTAVHVEKDVSAQVFSEWLEFTPYEVGLWRYGVFLKTEHFGGKFYKGRLIRQNYEQFMHYLQGVWGSAFTILFQRLLQPAETQTKDDGKDELNDFFNDKELKHKSEDSDSDDEVETDNEDEYHINDNPAPSKEERAGILDKIGAALAFPFIWIYHAVSGKPKGKAKGKGVNHRTKAKDEPFWKDWLNNIISSSKVLGTREGRAAEIHNIFRGLKITNVHGDGDRIVSTDVKNTFLVDGGLSFNSPYPSLLRPERTVNLILSFDFSQRDHDNTPPFEELLLAEKWARDNNRPFPPVKDNPIIKDPNIKELYIFEDENDPKCPIVMHFVLINNHFRNFKAPGVPRETEEEKKFGNFDIFDDPSTPYSSFKFNYTHKEFDRLYGLTRFNTLLHMQDIKEKILQAVKNCKV